MTIAVGELYEVKAVAYCVDQIGINVLHFVCTDSDLTVGLDAGTLATYLDATFGPLYKGLMSEDAEYVGMFARLIYPVQGAEFSGRLNAGAATVLGDALPRQCTGLLSKRADPPGPPLRGRLYMPFPSEMDCFGAGLPTVSYVTRLQSFGDTLDNVITLGTPTQSDATMRLCILNRAIPGMHNIVTSTAARSSFATQRRRGSYGRPNTRP